MVNVKREELTQAFDWVSSAPESEHTAYVSLDTGQVHWVWPDGDVDEEDLPDDIETSDRYLAIPHRNELDLGRELAIRFAAERLPRRAEKVREIFHRRGAYARFKDLLEAEGRLGEWYEFESKATDQALSGWCEVNDVTLV